MNANLYALFAARFPKDHTALFLETDSGERYCYADLERETARLASYLTGLGIARGERIAVQVEKSPQALFLYLACLRAGLVYLPLNSAYQEGEVSYFLENAGPKVVVAQPKSMRWLRPIADRLGIEHVFSLDEDGQGTLTDGAAKAASRFVTVDSTANDLAAILYTSGTTGRSKGAMITHRNLSSNAEVLHRFWGFEPQDVLLHSLPLFHVHGLFVACHCVLMNGSGMIFHRKFDANAVLRDLPRATVFMGVPTYYTRLLGEAGFDREACRHMRLFISGSAPLLSETFSAFQRRTGHAILERYGMTETGMLTSNPLDAEHIGGTVGVALPGVSVRIVDDENRELPADEVGHIQVKGENVLSGYWCMPEKNKEEFTSDGYFRTGDMGKVDAKGYFSIVGRSKDLVICGGYNVYPKEIELLIDELPDVVESAVIGLPHPDFGEAVVAVVVPKVGGNGLTEEAVIASLRQRLANFKVPKRVYFVADLPRNAMGKVQKNELRKRFSEPQR
jgi:malonyl-CoA/methylmalonyl-CoA synthetase